MHDPKIGEEAKTLFITYLSKACQFKPIIFLRLYCHSITIVCQTICCVIRVTIYDIVWLKISKQVKIKISNI